MGRLNLDFKRPSLSPASSQVRQQRAKMKTRLPSPMRAPSDAVCPRPLTQDMWRASTDELPFSHHVAPFVSYLPVGSWSSLKKKKKMQQEHLIHCIYGAVCFNIWSLNSDSSSEPQFRNPRWPPCAPTANEGISDTVCTPNPPLVLKLCHPCTFYGRPLIAFAGPSCPPGFLFLFLRISGSKQVIKPLCVDAAMPCKQQIYVWFLWMCSLRGH